MIESRANTLWRHIHALIRETSTSWPSFAMALAEHYNEHMPEAQRRVHFHTGTKGKDPYEAARLDAQKIRRMEDEGNLLVDLEESIPAVMPAERKDALMQDLFRRYGCLNAPIPKDDSPAAPAVELAKFIAGTGRAIESVAPLLDGDASRTGDDAEMERALDEIDRMIAAGTTIRARIKAHAPDRVICVDRARNRMRSTS